MKLDNPLVSIIIPCYNGSKFIDKCLTSIFNQAYKNFEVIVINDGSTDNSLELLSKYNIKVISQDNAGQGKARNVGLNNSNGDYICFIDIDDYIDEHYLEKLVNAVTSNDYDIAICSYYDVCGDKIIYNNFKLDKELSIFEFYRCCLDHLVWSVVPWNKIYKSSLLKNIRFKEGTYYEDEPFLDEVIKSSNKIISISDSLYYYVQNPSSTMKTNIVFRKLFRVESRTNRINYFLDNNWVDYYLEAVRENLFLLLRLKDLTKKHKVYKSIYKKQVDDNEYNLKLSINRSIKKGIHNEIQVYLYAKCKICFNIIYLCRKIVRVILKRNYENA